MIISKKLLLILLLVSETAKAAGYIVPPWKLANTTDIEPRTTGITHVYGNTQGFSLSCGGTAAATAQLDVLPALDATVGEIVKQHSSTTSADYIDFEDSGSTVWSWFDKHGSCHAEDLTYTYPSASTDTFIAFQSSPTVNTINVAAPTLGSAKFNPTWNFTVAQTATNYINVDSSPSWIQGFGTTGSDNVSVFGLRSNPTVDVSAGSRTLTNLYGIFTAPTNTGNTGTINNVYGIRVAPTIGGTNFFSTSVFGAQITPTVNSNTSLTSLYGEQLQPTVSASPTMTFVYGQRISPSFSASASISNYIASQLEDSGTVPTVAIGYRQRGTNMHNRFVGEVQIGADAAPGAQLQVNAGTSSTIAEIIQGAASQSSDLWDVQTSTPTIVDSVSSNGTFTMGPSSSTLIHQINGGVNQTTRTITANLTVDTTTTDFIIFCNHSSAINITLPAPTNGRHLIIKDISGSAGTNNITLKQHASEKIEGIAASRTLQTDWGSWNIVSDGTNWFIL